MRSLQRDWRELHYAVPVKIEPILDEYGNDTLELKTEYSEPIALKVNVSANAGQEAANVFGTLTGYSRTITYSGDSCPLVVGCRVWFGIDISSPHNYVVIKVADSKNGFVVALREVSDHG